MGPELLTAIIGPLLGGTITIMVWVGKRNTEAIDKGFFRIQASVEAVDTKIEDLKVEVAKNYVTREELLNHMHDESDWHGKTEDTLKAIREDVRENRTNIQNNTDRLRNDIAEIKEMQWRTRIGMLDLVDRKNHQRYINTKGEAWKDIDISDDS